MTPKLTMPLRSDINRQISWIDTQNLDMPQTSDNFGYQHWVERMHQKE